MPHCGVRRRMVDLTPNLLMLDEIKRWHEWIL